MEITYSQLTEFGHWNEPVASEKGDWGWWGGGPHSVSERAFKSEAAGVTDQLNLWGCSLSYGVGVGALIRSCVSCASGASDPPHTPPTFFFLSTVNISAVHN